MTDISSDKNRIPFYVREILSLIVSKGHKAYVAGGAVRDIVLSKIPHDYDVATSARPDEVVNIFKDSGTAFPVISDKIARISPGS